MSGITAISLAAASGGAEARPLMLAHARMLTRRLQPVHAECMAGCDEPARTQPAPAYGGGAACRRGGVRANGPHHVCPAANVAVPHCCDGPTQHTDKCSSPTSRRSAPTASPSRRCPRRLPRAPPTWQGQTASPHSCRGSCTTSLLSPNLGVAAGRGRSTATVSVTSQPCVHISPLTARNIWTLPLHRSFPYKGEWAQ